jgi:hypothetical protein
MKLCIVGNSPNILDGKNGEFIDSCDVVVRINDFIVGGEYKDSVGEKIDIVSYSFSPENKMNVDYIKTAKQIWCCRIFDDKRKSVAKAKLPKDYTGEIIAPSKDLWKQACKVVEGHWRGQPSSGLATYFMAESLYPDYEIYLTGFDRDENKKHYFDPKFLDKGKPGHDWAKEMDYFSDLEKNGKIKFL